MYDKEISAPDIGFEYISLVIFDVGFYTEKNIKIEEYGDNTPLGSTY